MRSGVSHVAVDRIVVLDTNALINNVQLNALGERFVTVGEVLEEIKDAEARRRLDMLRMRGLELRVGGRNGTPQFPRYDV